ncbi:replication initiator [Streptomyces griseoluteus]
MGPGTYPRPFGPPPLHTSGPRSREALIQTETFAAITASWFGPDAEFQMRGAAHCHAVVGLDRTWRSWQAPPAWATVALLDDAIRAAAARVPVPLPSREPALRMLRWSSEVDVQPISTVGREELTEQAVASYGRVYGRVLQRCAPNSERQRKRAGVSETDSRPLPQSSALVSA